VYTVDGMKSSIFKPFLIAVSVILTFGFIRIWTAQVIQAKGEGEGFAIIGWRQTGYSRFSSVDFRENSDILPKTLPIFAID